MHSCIEDTPLLPSEEEDKHNCVAYSKLLPDEEKKKKNMKGIKRESFLK